MNVVEIQGRLVLDAQHRTRAVVQRHFKVLVVVLSPAGQELEL